MDRITRFAISNSPFSILLLVGIFFFGLYTYFTMPSQEDPEITIRDAQITVFYPGLSIAMTEELIAKPIERKLRQISEIENITTTVKPGFVLVQPRVFDRYFDLQPIWQDVRNKMIDVRPALPEGTIGPFVNDDFGDVAAATVALHGRDFSMAQLDEMARRLKDRLGAVPSISKVVLYGVQRERIFIDVNMDKIAQIGMSFTEVISALRAQNVILPGGEIRANGLTVEIEPSGNFRTLEEMQQLPISVPGRTQVIYLRDIATLTRDYEFPARMPSYFNGEPAIIIGISMVNQFNIAQFSDIVDAALNDARADLPAGMRIDVVTWQPTFVKASVDDASSTLIMTVVVVLGVVVLFLGLRMGLIVGAIVPLAIFLTIVVMHLMGVELHRMSIAAIIISLCLLVDNGVVIAEDIRARMDSGTSKHNAAIATAKAFGLLLLFSTCTTILAFLPLLLAENVVGEFLRSLGIVLSIALFGSWFLSVYATPAICVWTLKESGGAAATQTGGFMAHLQSGYQAVLRRILAARYFFLLMMVGLFIGAVLLMQFVPRQMMPPSSRNQYLVYVDLVAGTDIDKTIAASATLSRWLNDRTLNPEVASHVSYVGFGGPRFFLALTPVDPSENTLFMVVNTKNAEDVPQMMRRTDNFIRQQMPGVSGVSRQMSLSQDEVGLVEYRISGPDEATLWQLAGQYMDAMRSIPGSIGIRNNWQNPILRIAVEVDQIRARRAGVTSESIARTLGAYFRSVSISDFREGDKVIPIAVRGDVGRDNIDLLRSLSVISNTGRPVPLMQVADFHPVIEPSRIMRFNQERTMTVEGMNPAYTALGFDQAVRTALGDVATLPRGYHVEMGGEIEGSARANNALFQFMPLAFVLMFILLVLKFNSVVRPAIIFLTIPLCLIGVSVGLLMTGAFLDFNGLLGLLSLAGIIIVNGIVLIDRIDSERSQTDRLEDAVVTACGARLRPILMTTLTTCFGLIPMVLFGEELWFAMGIVIMFGLLIGTVLTLGFVPALYSVLLRNKPPAATPQALTEQA
jgi:multidrug efflux pump subunit AcrB